MKKTFTILTTTIIILIAFKTKAQDTKEYVKSYFGLTGGVSIPVGDFAKSDYSNNKAGFAKKGVMFGFNGAYYFYKNLAFTAILSYQDQGELSQNDAQTLANGYNSDFKSSSTTVSTVNRYHNINLMGGPQYSFVYKKFTFDVRAVAGLIKSFSTPTIDISYTNNANQYIAITQNNSKSKAFAYGGGVGVRYSLGDNWDVNLRGNYIASDGLTITTKNAQSNGRVQTKQPITEIQTTLGISLHF